MKNTFKKLDRKEEILKLLKSNKEMKVKDLAKELGMWDSHLRKKINILIKDELVEKFIKDNYTYVKIRKR